MILLSIKISQKYEVTGEKKTPIYMQVYVFYHDTISIQIEEEKKHLHKNKHIFFILAHLMLQLKYSHTKQL